MIGPRKRVLIAATAGVSCSFAVATPVVHGTIAVGGQDVLSMDSGIPGIDFASNTTIDIFQNASLSLSNIGGDAATSITKLGAGRLEIRAAGTFAGTISLGAGTLAFAESAGAMVLAGSTQIDIGGGSLEFDYSNESPADAVLAVLVDSSQNDFASGAIFSSTLPPGRSIGWVDSTSSVIVRQAWPGDTDLSGGADFDDLIRLARNYGRSDSTWMGGDFDYDADVDFADLVALARHFGSTAIVAGLIPDAVRVDLELARTVVPEPALAVMLIAPALLLRRQQRGLHR